MDIRIGYGLELKKAIEVGLAEAEQQGQVVHFSIIIKDHLVVWGELRDDGWRVYAPPVKSDRERTAKP